MKPFQYDHHAGTVLSLLPKGTRFKITNHKKAVYHVVKAESDGIVAVQDGSEHLYPQEYPDVSCFPIQGLCEYYDTKELKII